MRIGLFSDTYTPDINGVVSSTVTLKKYLEKRGHEVFVVTNHSGTGIDYDGSILRLPGMKLKMLYGYNLSSPINQKATETITEMNLDVIHLQTNFGVGLYGQRLARHFGIPCVMTYHTMFEDYTHYINPLNLEKFEKISKEAIRKISKIIFNTAQAVIAPSLKTKESLDEYGVLTPVTIIPSGLELDTFNPRYHDQQKIEEFRKSISDDPKAIYFLYLGRLADEKGIDMLIEAFGKSPDHYHLIITGDGPEAEKYKEEASRVPARDRIHFTGSVPPEEVALHYSACDAFCSASTSETQGITYIEALASGKMIFTRRDPVLKGLVDEGKSGYFFDSADELLEKAAQLEKLSEEQKKLNIQNCLDKAEPYSAETFAQRVEKIYRDSVDHYLTTYKVIKAKEKNDFIELVLEHDLLEDNLELWIPYDDYFQMEITSSAKLEHYLVEYYKNRQNEYKAFYSVKKRALSRDMSSGMIRDYLNAHFVLTPEQVSWILGELIQKELIDDEAFAMDYASLRHDMGYSKRQIAMSLIKKGVDSAYVQKAIDQLEEETEQKNAGLLAKKFAKSIKNQSNRLKKQTIYKKLLAKGFSSETAHKSMENLDLENDEDQALELCLQKAARLYQDQKDGFKKAQKIKLYALRKGFSISDIEERLESLIGEF